MSSRSKSLLEGLQTFAGVTRSELLVALSLLLFSCASLLYRIVQDPRDPLKEELHARIRQVLDSSARAQDSIRKTLDAGALDSLELPADIKAPSPYKVKRAPAQPINPATASAEDLQRIPGIGPALAERIIHYRRTHKLRRLEQLREIRGIGPKLYAKITVSLRLPAVSKPIVLNGRR